MTQETRVSLSVTTAEPEQITRAIETLSRAANGLALEGINGVILFGPDSDDEI